MTLIHTFHSNIWNNRLSTLDHDEAGPDDWQKILCGDQILKRGSPRSEQIERLQDLLREKGFTINDHQERYRGDFGPQTEYAVIEFQRIHGLKVDGIVGRQTMQALLYQEDPVIRTSGKTWDPLTDKRIMTLHPLIRDKTFSFINRVETTLQIKLRVTDAFRSFEKQDQLYWQSRDKSGRPWVTDAKAGQSYHNYGLAIDVLEIKNNRISNKTDWMAVAKIAKDEGFSWGGDWENNRQDLGHFEMTLGYSWRELLTMYQSNNRSRSYLDLTGGDKTNEN